MSDDIRDNPEGSDEPLGEEALDAFSLNDISIRGTSQPVSTTKPTTSTVKGIEGSTSTTSPTSPTAPSTPKPAPFDPVGVKFPPR